MKTLMATPDPFNPNDEVVHNGASYEVFQVLDDGRLMLMRGWDLFPVNVDEVSRL